MSRFDQILTWIENGIAGLALSGAAIIAITQVILRTFFNHIIFWSEEAVIYLIILSTFVGAVITLRHNEHVNIDIVPALLGERGKRVMAIIAAFFVVVYCAVIGGYAWLMITEPAVRMSFTLAMHLPLWVVQLSLPIGLTLMLVRALEILYRTARGRETFEEAEDTAYEEEASR